ncbi:MEKK [Handroanthus impetiginosus]|uniref:mitogen-activated protein kinase kinase kinase n=1 Tax=Handroanthus impetiginosus TaxID=429701 RepID=A0A2G9GPH6_9LAMI|nr:MEKK [Handroanthus impetiginosus]
MYRLPKIFSHSSERRRSRDSGSGSGSSRQAAKPKRLDRLNAAKNINYEFSPSTSGSSSLYSSEESSCKRSPDLFGGKMSFRVDGSIDELETICKTLGFSGIDDFAIPLEEYEAMKVRSSSAPVVCNREFRLLVYQKTEVDCDDVVECSGNCGCIKVVDLFNRQTEGSDMYVSSDVVSKKFEEGGDFGYMNRSRAPVFGTNTCELSKISGGGVMVSDVILTDNIRGRSSEFRGNGIKGARPPVLAPPPLVTLPEMDNRCSTWDASGGLVRDNYTRALGFEREIYLDKDEERTETGGQERSEQEEDFGRTVMMREENYVLSGSCSFTTTSIDDDSSSTTTEMMSSISPSRKFRRVIRDWQKGDLLGSGSFGSVYEGIADDGFFFAVKEVSLLDQGDEGKQRIIQLEQEIALLSQFEHENIVRYYGTKKDEAHLYIFLELVTKGSLLSLYQKYDLRVPQVSAYTRQILHGLKYLHDKNVVHRDIKCANILVHTNGLVKLADFGLAKATKLNDVKSCKGTAFWMAPEVVRSQWYGLAADIWSLGCTVLEMLTRRFPYSNLECQMAALYRIGRGQRPSIPETIPSDARDFILQCLQVDPSLRPTAAQLLEHPFVKRPLPSSSGTASPHSFGRQI